MAAIQFQQVGSAENVLRAFENLARKNERDRQRRKEKRRRRKARQGGQLTDILTVGGAAAGAAIGGPTGAVVGASLGRAGGSIIARNKFGEQPATDPNVSDALTIATTGAQLFQQQQAIEQREQQIAALGFGAPPQPLQGPPGQFQQGPGPTPQQQAQFELDSVSFLAAQQYAQTGNVGALIQATSLRRGPAARETFRLATPPEREALGDQISANDLVQFSSTGKLFVNRKPVDRGDRAKPSPLRTLQIEEQNILDQMVALPLDSTERVNLDVRLQQTRTQIANKISNTTPVQRAKLEDIQIGRQKDANSGAVEKLAFDIETGTPEESAASAAAGSEILKGSFPVKSESRQRLFTALKNRSEEQKTVLLNKEITDAITKFQDPKVRIAALMDLRRTTPALFPKNKNSIIDAAIEDQKALRQTDIDALTVESRELEIDAQRRANTEAGKAQVADVFVEGAMERASTVTEFDVKTGLTRDIPPAERLTKMNNYLASTSFDGFGSRSQKDTINRTRQELISQIGDDKTRAAMQNRHDKTVANQKSRDEATKRHRTAQLKLTERGVKLREDAADVATRIRDKSELAQEYLDTARRITFRQTQTFGPGIITEIKPEKRLEQLNTYIAKTAFDSYANDDQRDKLDSLRTGLIDQIRDDSAKSAAQKRHDERMVILKETRELTKQRLQRADERGDELTSSQMLAITKAHNDASQFAERAAGVAWIDMEDEERNVRIKSEEMKLLNLRQQGDPDPRIQSALANRIFELAEPELLVSLKNIPENEVIDRQAVLNAIQSRTPGINMELVQTLVDNYLRNRPLAVEALPLERELAVEAVPATILAR